MNHYLPTDDEFLESLYKEPTKEGEPYWQRQEFIEEAIALLNSHNAIPDGVEPAEFVQEMLSPKSNFRGFKPSSLKEQAARILPQDLHPLLDTPLGFLHLDELNGFAARSPRGNAVIILNMGVLLYAQLLARCTLSLTRYGSPTPFCRDHQPVAFVHAIVMLGRYAITQDESHMFNIRVWNCPSLPDPDWQSAGISNLVELFVYFHELGHVKHNHLSSAKTIEINGIQAYNLRHEQEHEADSFAFTHFAKAHGNGRTAFVAQLLFRFFDLIEHLYHGKPTPSPTHPAGRDRWNYLKKHFSITEEECVEFGKVSSLFDMILDVRHNIDEAILAVA